MLIQPTQQELWGLNQLNQDAQNLQVQLQRIKEAQWAFIGLLETKYNAVFDEKSGQLNPKKEKSNDKSL